MRKVERLFLSVGAMRTGTTWLYNMIKDHPALYFTPQKELHFLYDYYQKERQFQSLELPLWDRKYITSPPTNERPENYDDRLEKLGYLFSWALLQLNHRLTFDYYRGLFSLRGYEKYSCDMSNLTSFLTEEQLRDITYYFDEIKVMYVMRDPIRRLWSHFTYNNNRRNVDIPFEEKAWSQEDILRWLNGGNKLVPDASDYAGSVKKLGSVFGDDFKVFYYEDLVNDTRGTLRKLEEFLGIEAYAYSQEKIDKVVNFATGNNKIWPLFIETVTPFVDEQMNELKKYVALHPQWFKYEDCT